MMIVNPLTVVAILSHVYTTLGPGFSEAIYHRAVEVRVL